MLHGSVFMKRHGRAMLNFYDARPASSALRHVRFKGSDKFLLRVMDGEKGSTISALAGNSHSCHPARADKNTGPIAKMSGIFPLFGG